MLKLKKVFLELNSSPLVKVTQGVVSTHNSFIKFKQVTTFTWVLTFHPVPWGDFVKKNLSYFTASSILSLHKALVIQYQSSQTLPILGILPLLPGLTRSNDAIIGNFPSFLLVSATHIRLHSHNAAYPYPLAFA